MVQLGDKVKDKVTGVTGIVMTLSSHLTGCDTAWVQPGIITPEGKLSECLCFDITRLEILQARCVVIDTSRSKPGGPHFNY